MHDDPSTLEMLKKVSVRGLRWCLVERATHLLLAVVVGYWIGRNEKSDIEKVYDSVNANRAEIVRQMRQKREEASHQQGNRGSITDSPGNAPRAN